MRRPHLEGSWLVAQTVTTIQGMDGLRRALKAVPEVASAHISDAIGLTTFAVAQRARSLVPVASGVLKASIGTTKPSKTRTGINGNVGLTDARAYYWRFVEYGTKHMAARPFFRPAAESESDDFVQRLRAIGPKIEREMSGGRFT